VADIPDTKFVRLGEDRIAYQVFGEGPPDLVYMAGTTDTIDLRWEWPPYAHFLRRLGSFSRVVMFDRRGQGGSDPVSTEGISVWEDWADDTRAVLDAVGSERAALFAGIESTPIALLFAATEPDRSQSLILFAGTARFASAEDYPWGLPVDALLEAEGFFVEHWGTEEMASVGSPILAEDPAFRRWFAKSQRAAASAREAAATLTRIRLMDVRQVLSSVRTPTLVVHRKDFEWVPIEQSRFLADSLPDGRLLLSDGDSYPYSGPVEEILQEVEVFVTGARNRAAATDRVLATVLFTDIVGSTQRAASEGDQRWRTLLESHDTITSGVIEQHDGRVVKLTGDGVLATFDGPGRAVRCACALRDALRTLAIEIRAGIHTGEVEVRGDDISGIGVHVAARVMDHADPGQIWVSGAVPLLMAGSNVEFESRGEWALKGVPGEWPLLAIKS
jgi:class 3 adenylate cyclase/alpha-beta hydrolase superfamily lysophospholipase